MGWTRDNPHTVEVRQRPRGVLLVDLWEDTSARRILCNVHLRDAGETVMLDGSIGFDSLPSVLRTHAISAGRTRHVMRRVEVAVAARGTEQLAQRKGA